MLLMMSTTLTPYTYTVTAASAQQQHQRRTHLSGRRFGLGICPSTSHSHTYTHSLSLVLVVMTKSKELKTKISHTHSLILSLWHTSHPVWSLRKRPARLAERQRAVRASRVGTIRSPNHLSTTAGNTLRTPAPSGGYYNTARDTVSFEASGSTTVDSSQQLAVRQSTWLVYETEHMVSL